MPGIDQTHLEPRIGQYLPQRNPVNAGRFHRYPLYLALLEPCRDPAQILGKAREAAHRLLIAVRRYRHVNLGSPYINASRVGMQHRQAQYRSCFLLRRLPSLRIAGGFTPARPQSGFCHTRLRFCIRRGGGPAPTTKALS